MDFLTLFKQYQSTKLTQKLSDWHRDIDHGLTLLHLMLFFAGIFTCIMIIAGQSSSEQFPTSVISLNIAIILGLGLFGNFYCSKKIKNEYPKESIRNNIGNHLYQGSLYDIFDKECPYTIAVLKKYKSDLEKTSAEYQGIYGYTLCNIQDAIDLDKEKSQKDSDNIILKELSEI